MSVWHLDILHDTFVVRKKVVRKLCSCCCRGDHSHAGKMKTVMWILHSGAAASSNTRAAQTHRNTINELNEMTMSCHRMNCSEWRGSFLITVSGNRNRIYWHKYFLIFPHHVLHLWNINSFIRPPLFTCSYLTSSGCDWLQSQCALSAITMTELAC